MKWKAGWLVAVLATLFLAQQAIGRELEGVTLPDQVQVSGKTLALNGMGVRVKFFVHAYVGALYLEHPTHDGRTAVTADEPKRVQLVLLRNLSRDRMVDSLREGFEANAGNRMPGLKSRMDQMATVMEDGKRGDWMAVTYDPVRATTTVHTSGGKTTVIPGKDFAEVLFSTWVGDHPVDDGLKDGMLGKG